MSSSSRRAGLSAFVSLVLLLGAFVVAGTAPASAVPDPGPGQGVLEGFVHDVSIEGLAGVTVDAFPVGVDPDAEPAAASTTTPSEAERAPGYWALALAAGEYRLRFSGDGLQTQWYGGGAGDVVEVYEGDTRRLAPTTVRGAGQAVVTGYLYDPAAGRYVNDLLVEAIGEAGVGASSLTYESTKDWNDGFFALYLPAGTWQVRVSDPDGRGYEPLDLGEVAVGEDDEVDLGENVVSRLVGQVSVRVVDSAGAPLDGARVKVMSLPGWPRDVRKAWTDDAGTALLADVPVSTDRYTVCVSRGTGDVCLGGVTRRRHATPIAVLAGETVEVELTIDQLSITGSVIDEGGDPYPDVTVEILAVDDGGLRYVGEGWTESTGRFEAATRRAGTDYTACAYHREAMSCLGGATDPEGADTFTIEPGATAYEIEEPLVLSRPCQGRVVTNGTVSLGVNCLGQLNLENPYVGLTYNPTQNDSTVAGCPCEGWGVADADSRVSGFANNASGISRNLELLDFSVEEDDEGQARAATSTVQVGDTFVITHDYRPSSATEYAYEVNVSVENISGARADLRYRRVMDWDIAPTEFSEYVTLQTGDAEELVFASNDGFASADPLAGASDLGHVGDFVDAGPEDHGALFDFAFGSLRAGETKTFRTFYGGAGTETDALDALAAINAESYSLGQPSTPDGPTLGTPNTFLFAFSGVGGSAVVPPVAVDDRFMVAKDDAGARLLVLENDSHPAGRTLRIASHTPAGHGEVSCTSSDCTYVPESGYVGADSFGYTITDGRGGFDSAAVSLDVSDDAAGENTEPPSISGTPVVGSELAAGRGEWTSGGGELSFAYRWLRDGEPIGGAGGSTYTPVAADLDRALSVRVTATRPGAAPAAAESAAVTVGAGAAPANTSLPTIPSAAFDRLVSAAPGAWTPTPTRFTYQWRLDGTDVPGATADSYRPSAGDVGKALSVVVTGRTPGYSPASAESAARTVAAGPAAVNSARPTITGVARSGDELSAERGAWSGSGLDFGYQWLVDGVPVDGATDSTWTVDAVDGALVSVRVTARRAGHDDATADSESVRVGAAATEIVAAPSIEGTPTIRETLTLVPAEFADDDVDVSTTWYATYRWSPEYRFLLQRGGDELLVPDWGTGMLISVEQVATRSGTAPVASASPAVGPVEGLPSLFGGTRGLTGSGRIGEPVTLTGTGWFTYSPGHATVDGVSETVTWWVDGRAVGSGPSYTPTASDGGGDLYAEVVGDRAGYLTGYAYSESKRVRYADERDSTLRVSVKRARSPFTDVDGALVQACTWRECVTGRAADGVASLVLPARAAGTEYRIGVRPPAGSDLFTWSGARTVTAGAVEDLVVRLGAPEPIPAGTSLSATTGSTTTTGGSYPRVFFTESQELRVTGCAGLADRTWRVDFASGATPMTGVLTELASEPGVYTGTIPGFTDTGMGTIGTNVPPATDCAGEPISFTVYIDPSGIVSDQYGRPIPGAAATLLRADPAGVFTPVEDGSTVMSPANRRNPSFTDETGFFRWDVVDGTYQVRVSGARSGGAPCEVTTTPAMDVPPERVDLLIKVPCADASLPAPITAPVLSGTPTVGQTLTATPGTWGALLAHSRTEWLRDGVVVHAGSSYTLVAADQGKQVVARVYAQRAPYVQENGLGEVVTFTPTHVDLTSAPVAAAPGGGGGGGGGTPPAAVAPVNTVAPSVTGDAKVGDVLAAEPGTWDTDGLTFAYQWLRDGKPIDGATASVHTATKDDLGKPVAVRVTATKAGRPDGTATSAPVVVGLGDAPTVVEAPEVSGQPVVGEQLSVTSGTWSAEGLSFTYQWTRDGAPIDGATGPTYTVAEVDRGRLVGAVVTATKDGYADGTSVVDGVTVPADEEPEEPAESTTKVKVLDRPVRAGERAELKVVVRTVSGLVPTGTLQVRVVGGKELTRSLDETDDGVRTLKLPKLAAGKHRVRVFFLGSEDVEASRAELLKVRVKPARDGARPQGSGRSMAGLW